MAIRALPYYGGKSPARSGGVCHWIRDQLPWFTNQLYVEPFAGMLGVLLSRERVNSEVVNDKSERVVNWWRAVRDYPAEFAHLVDTTPVSRAEFDWAKDNLDNPDLSIPRRALAFHIIISQSIIHADRNAPAWAIGKQGDVVHRRFLGHDDITRLAARIDRVQLDTQDACAIVERCVDAPHALLYCDPPYRSSDTRAYSEFTVDVDRLSDLLLSCKGKVAISGYGDEWDHLGFERVTRRSYATATPVIKSHERTEVLWLNYTTHPRLF